MRIYSFINKKILLFFVLSKIFVQTFKTFEVIFSGLWKQPKITSFVLLIFFFNPKSSKTEREYVHQISLIL